MGKSSNYGKSNTEKEAYLVKYMKECYDEADQLIREDLEEIEGTKKPLTLEAKIFKMYMELGSYRAVSKYLSDCDGTFKVSHGTVQRYVNKYTERMIQKLEPCKSC